MYGERQVSAWLALDARPASAAQNSARAHFSILVFFIWIPRPGSP